MKECGVKEQKRISRQKLREYKWNRNRESIYEYGNTIKTLCATARYFDKEDVNKDELSYYKVETTPTNHKLQK